MPEQCYMGSPAPAGIDLGSVLEERASTNRRGSPAPAGIDLPWQLRLVMRPPLSGSPAPAGIDPLHAIVLRSVGVHKGGSPAPAGIDLQGSAVC